jgi:hypothetical protein
MATKGSQPWVAGPLERLVAETGTSWTSSASSSRAATTPASAGPPTTSAPTQLTHNRIEPQSVDGSMRGDTATLISRAPVDVTNGGSADGRWVHHQFAQPGLTVGPGTPGG